MLSKIQYNPSCFSRFSNKASVSFFLPETHHLIPRGMKHHHYSWESMGKDSGDIVCITMSCKLHKLYYLRQSCPFYKLEFSNIPHMFLDLWHAKRQHLSQLWNNIFLYTLAEAPPILFPNSQSLKWIFLEAKPMHWKGASQR